jgi:hypothetical protein
MTKLRSEFHEMKSVSTQDIKTGRFVDNDEGPFADMKVETVFEGSRIVAMFIVMNGERIAYRGREGKPIIRRGYQCATMSSFIMASTVPAARRCNDRRETFGDVADQFE